MKAKLSVSVILICAVCMGGSVGAEGEKFAVLAVVAMDGAKEKVISEVQAPFLSMDFDDNGRVNITDVQGMIDWLYLGGTPAACPAAMDFDGNGQVNVTDLMGLMEWMYLGGESPASLEAVPAQGCYSS